MVSLDQMCSVRSRVEPGAVDLLVRYLREVDRNCPAVSAAISEGLEIIWKKSSRCSGSAYCLTTAIFRSLGKIFDKNYFGCNAKIFREMESFFHRHALEIMQRMPEGLFTYIISLDRMSLNKPGKMEMMPTLTSLVQNLGLSNMHNWSEAQYLSRRSQYHLSRLLMHFRTEITRHRPNMTRQLYPHSPLHNQSRRPIAGSTMDPRYLMDLCLHEPHRITVNDRGSVDKRYLDYDRFPGLDPGLVGDGCSEFCHSFIEDNAMCYPQDLLQGPLLARPHPLGIDSHLSPAIAYGR